MRRHRNPRTVALRAASLALATEQHRRVAVNKPITIDIRVTCVPPEDYATLPQMDFADWLRREVISNLEYEGAADVLAVANVVTLTRARERAQ